MNINLKPEELEKLRGLSKFLLAPPGACNNISITVTRLELNGNFDNRKIETINISMSQVVDLMKVCGYSLEEAIIFSSKLCRQCAEKIFNAANESQYHRLNNCMFCDLWK